MSTEWIKGDDGELYPLAFDEGNFEKYLMNIMFQTVEQENVVLNFTSAFSEDMDQIVVLTPDGKYEVIFIDLIQPDNDKIPHYFTVEYSDKDVMNHTETLADNDELTTWLRIFMYQHKLQPVNPPDDA